MRIDLQQLKHSCSERGMSLSVMLESAGVSRNAFYSLTRRASVLPGSILAIAEYLQISPSEFLVDEGSRAQQGRVLLKQIDEIAARNPKADRDTIRHTLILLQENPVERLRRALQRARSINLQ